MSLHSTTLSNTKTALTRTDDASFLVTMDLFAVPAGAVGDFLFAPDRREYRGWLAVIVYNGSDTPVSNGAEGADTLGRVYFPINFIIKRNS